MRRVRTDSARRLDGRETLSRCEPARSAEEEARRTAAGALLTTKPLGAICGSTDGVCAADRVLDSVVVPPAAAATAFDVAAFGAAAFDAVAFGAVAPELPAAPGALVDVALLEVAPFVTTVPSSIPFTAFNGLFRVAPGAEVLLIIVVLVVETARRSRSKAMSRDHNKNRNPVPAAAINGKLRVQNVDLLPSMLSNRDDAPELPELVDGASPV